MFTGIVREVGRIASREGEEDGMRLVVSAPATAPTTGLGDSIAVNGVCLTAEAIDGDHVTFSAVPETLGRTTLGVLQPGDDVNVEPALRAGDPMGGHVMQGHVDGVATVQSVEAEGEGLRVFVAATPALLRYCVEKGSVAVDGVSLTVAELADDAFAVALVPHTLEASTLGRLTPGRPVNVEVDILAKYVERLLLPG